jgi:hypothetical protein
LNVKYANSYVVNTPNIVIIVEMGRNVFNADKYPEAVATDVAKPELSDTLGKIAIRLTNGQST